MAMLLLICPERAVGGRAKKSGAAVGCNVCGIDPPSPHLLLIAAVLGSSSYVREETWGISPFCSGEAANYESEPSYVTTRASDSGRNTQR